MHRNGVKRLRKWLGIAANRSFLLFRLAVLKLLDLSFYFYFAGLFISYHFDMFYK